MNDFSELEAELKELRPAAPSHELSLRIERALAAAAAITPSAGVLRRPRTSRLNWFTLGLGVAAAAAAFLLLARPEVERVSPSQPTIAASTPALSNNALPTERRLVPEGVTRVVYDTRNEGLVFPGNGAQPVRRLRAHSQETLQWRDRQTGASLRVSYPTEEVELIPISGQ